MLQITVPYAEQWDEKNQEFIYTKEQTLQLEHSLVSLSKWEEKWHKPFFSEHDKTIDETLDYIRCMTITKNVKPDIYNALTSDNISQINEYMADPMTATVIHERNNKKKNNREEVTSELLYCRMIELNIPVEFQKWHISRLTTLIRLLDKRSSPPEKVSKREIMSRNAQLNAARREKLNSKG